MQDAVKTDKGPFIAKVASNYRLHGTFYRLVLEFEGTGAAAFVQTTPGQFAQLDLSGVSLPDAKYIPESLKDAAMRHTLLRRPFSFIAVDGDENHCRVEILYCVVGPSSLRMTTLRSGHSVSVIGPLGNGFSMKQNKTLALLVVGGMGAGPLVHMAGELTKKQPEMQVLAFAGARTKKELPFEKVLDEVSQGVGFSIREFGRYAVESKVATDDGTLGFSGLVTDCLQQWLDQNRPETKETIIYSCGPEPMIKRMAEMAQQWHIECQLSLERNMGCGVGLCQSCAVACKSETSEMVYKMCCKDGPVFDSRELVFKD